MRRFLAITLMLVLLASVCLAAENLPLTNQKEKESYSLGYEFGNNLKRYGVAVDMDVLLLAIREGLEGKKPRLTSEEMNAALAEQRRTLTNKHNMRLQEYATKNLQAGKEFLENNKSKPGVMTLPSGLQYKVLREGNGPTPTINDQVKLNYRGSFIDGKEFDNSQIRKDFKFFPMDDVLEGWRQALQLMKVGSKWQIFVPPELAYGHEQAGRIPPNSTLIFDLELLDLKPQPTLEEVMKKESF